MTVALNSVRFLYFILTTSSSVMADSAEYPLDMVLQHNGTIFLALHAVAMTEHL